jgi:hypothetical protein
MLECDDFRWIFTDDLKDYAFPAADHKIINVLKKMEA